MHKLTKLRIRKGKKENKQTVNQVKRKRKVVLSQQNSLYKDIKI